MKDFNIVEYIQKHFKYNADGSFTRLDRKNSNGSYDKDGYLILKIKGKQYKAHRLVYAWHNGKMPEGEIDHINRIRNDNRVENLRVVNRQENILNSARKVNVKTGAYGVHLDRTNGLKKNFATKLGGKTYRFKTLEEAERKRREYYADKKEFMNYG